MGLYNLILFVAGIAGLPVFLGGLVLFPRWREGIAARFGRITASPPGQAPAPLAPPQWGTEKSPAQHLWIHAASLGEMKAIGSLVPALQKSLPGVPMVLSATTSSGYKEALKISEPVRGTSRAPVVVTYLPLEFPFVLKRVFRRFPPRILILVETELWPNFIHYAKRSGATVMVLNGRFSEKGASRYALVKSLFHRMADPVDVWAMRTFEDRDRAASLGVDPARLLVTGNIKFQGWGPGVGPAGPFYDRLFRGSRVLVAGSTRPGEEEIVLDAFQNIRSDFPGLKLALAPRHLNRVPEVERLLTRRGIGYRKRTLWEGKGSFKEPVLLMDTQGELLAAYKTCTLALVGGSLVALGGHNILEPAAYGKPVIYGRHMGNFKEEAALLTERGVGFFVDDTAHLTSLVKALLANAPGRKKIAVRAKRLFKDREGLVQDNVRLITKLWKGNIK